MSKREWKRALRHGPERVVLSEVLPFETPITFTNRHFYSFLRTHQVQCGAGAISWQKGTPAVNAVIKLLTGTPQTATIQIVADAVEAGGDDTAQKIARSGERGSYNAKSIIRPFEPKSKPFIFKVRHKDHDTRDLVIPHPKNQIQSIGYYRDFQDMIIYHCSLSPYSIRYPSSVARYTYYRDRTHYSRRTLSFTPIEEADREYKSIRSYFSYKHYGNIYKFFESYRFHRAEKKFNQLLRLDIAKCFDSIYTHSIVWATMGKDFVKDNLHNATSFADEFDRLMQNINYGETNGIVIGPEISRIFAEVILQRVDRTTYQTLRRQNCFHRKDYEIYRYVDDYFIFSNDQRTANLICEVISHHLKEFKLHVNHEKSQRYEKPIITSITIAKQRIVALLEDVLAFKVEEKTIQANDIDQLPQVTNRESMRVNGNRLITDFKSILVETSVSYKDVLNYTLSLVEVFCKRLLRRVHSIDTGHSRQELGRAVLEILDFLFFIYAVEPRVNSTIRLARILHLFITFSKLPNGFPEIQHLLYQRIRDDLGFVMNKYQTTEYTPVETLYLLIVLRDLGRGYWLDLDTLCKYFKIRQNSDEFEVMGTLDYFSITVLLFYIQDKKRYASLLRFVEAEILRRLRARQSHLSIDAELVMLLLDSIACPYVSSETKREILSIYEVQDRQLQDEVILLRKNWFTTWAHFDLGWELEAKRGRDVY